MEIKENKELATKPKDFMDLLRSEKIKTKFNELLKGNSSIFLSAVQTVWQGTPALKECDPESLLFAVLQIATMNLRPDTGLGYVYIIPYKGKAQVQLGYKGFIQLTQRSREIRTLNACPVYRGQLIKYDPLHGHEFDFTVKASGEPIGFACYLELNTGFRKVDYITYQEATQHGKKFSKTFGRSDSVWNTNFEAMAMKTVIKRVLSKFAPLSFELQKAIEIDQAIVGKDGDYSYEDNPKNLNPEQVGQEKHDARLLGFIEKAKSVAELESVASSVNDATKAAFDSKMQELKAADNTEIVV